MNVWQNTLPLLSSISAASNIGRSIHHACSASLSQIQTRNKAHTSPLLNDCCIRVWRGKTITNRRVWIWTCWWRLCTAPEICSASTRTYPHMHWNCHHMPNNYTGNHLGAWPREDQAHKAGTCLGTSCASSKVVGSEEELFSLWSRHFTELCKLLYPWEFEIQPTKWFVHCARLIAVHVYCEWLCVHTAIRDGLVGSFITMYSVVELWPGSWGTTVNTTWYTPKDRLKACW